MLLLIGFFMMIGAYVYEPLFHPGMVVACSCLIPHFLWNKCPHCGKQLGRNEAEFCQFCGGCLDEE
jgi:hypothetical protein